MIRITIESFKLGKLTFTKLLTKVARGLLDYSESITHIDTGTWVGAHRMKITKTEANVFVDPGAVNPKSGQHAATYADVWESRGGEMAVYHRAIAESNAFDNLSEIIVGEVFG